MSELISRQAAIDEVLNMKVGHRVSWKDAVVDALDTLPSAEPTLYGYDIKQLELIARTLQKENLPPERVADVLSDIGRIVEIVCDEFTESLSKTELLKTTDYCVICKQDMCRDCIADATNPYCVPSHYEIKQTNNTGHKTEPQSEKEQTMRLIDADALFVDASFFNDELDRAERFYSEEQIKNAPTIDRPQGEWIPCSERMPRARESVLLAVNHKCGDWVGEGCYWETTDNHIIWKGYRWNATYWDDEIIAWMPLPEPWKGAENGKDIQSEAE